MSADDLPKGWTSTTVGELLPPGGIFDGPFGSKLKTKDYTDSGVRVVRLENVGHLEFVADKETFVSEAKYDELERHRVGEGDVIFASFVDKDVRVCRLPEIGPAIAKADCFCLRPDESLVDPDLLVYFLASKQSHAAFAERVQGATRPRVNTKHVKAHQLGLPPLPEQRRIVARLDAIETHRRAVKEKLDRLPNLLDRYRQSVLAAAFRGDLTAAWREAHPDTEPAAALLDRIRAERRRRWDEVHGGTSKKYKEPKAADSSDAPTAEVYGGIEGAGWVSAPLELLADPVRGIPYGIVQTGKYVEGGVPTVRCGDVKRFSIEATALKLVDPEIHANYARTVLEGGEVLVAIRGTVGATAVAGPDMAGMNISREVAMVPVLPGVSPNYLAYLLASPAGQALMAGKVVGVAQSGINLGDLRRLPTALPPEAEQAEIVRLVSAAMDRIDALEDAAQGRLADLDTLRQATLARAFRGELVPTDAALARADGRPAPAASGQGRGGAQTALDL